MRVKCLVQEHNTMTLAGGERGPIDWDTVEGAGT